MNVQFYMELPGTVTAVSKVAIAVLYGLATLTFIGLPEILGLLPMCETWRESR